MTAPIADATAGPLGGIAGVLARIATIQAQFTPAKVTAPAATGPTSSTAATSPTSSAATSFASALNQVAQPIALTASGTSVQNPSGTVNGVTYGAGSANATGADIVADAKTYLGVPYVFAGNGRNGIDCSGLVQQTYKDLGMSLPRISWEQQKVGTAVPSLAQAQPGDVLCFGDPAYHVAIYLGDNKMIEAPQPGEVVKIADVSPPPDEIRRIVGTSSAAPTTSLAPVSYPTGVAAYSSLFRTDETKYGLPTGLLGAIATVESNGNPNAVSPAGAQGLMQLMPGTAQSLGVNALDPTQAVDGAARMLQGLLQKYHGSITLAAAAYNAGAGAVDQYGGVPPYAETQAYVVKVQNALNSMQA